MLSRLSGVSGSAWLIVGRIVKNSVFCGMFIGIVGLGWFLLSRPTADAKADHRWRKASRVVVAAEPVRQESVERWVHADGVARAVRREFLKFQVSGRVIAIGTDETGGQLREGAGVQGPGGSAGQGTVLAEIDDRRYVIAVAKSKAELEQATQMIAVAKAEAEQAAADLECCQSGFARRKRLVDIRAVSEEAMEEARRRLTGATAGVRAAGAKLEGLVAARESAAANLERARLDLGHTRLRAPFDGVIAWRVVNVGDYASGANFDSANAADRPETCAFLVVDPSVFEITVAFPLLEGAQVEPGQEASIRRLGAGTPARTKAIVHSVSPRLTPKHHLVRVKLRTVGESPALFDGERVSARVCIRRCQAAVVVPRDALCFRGDRPFCYAVDAESHIATRRPLTLGIDQEGRVEVTEGVEVGELVATFGRHRLADGMRVRLSGEQ